MSEGDLSAFAAGHSDGAFVTEYVGGHVPGFRLVPMGRLPLHVGVLPRGQRVFLICAAGNRSLAADCLTRARVDAVSVAGGTNGWQRLGKPLIFGGQA